MKKIDVLNLNMLLNSSQAINEVTDINISYRLFELNKETQALTDKYVEYVNKSNDEDKQKIQSELLDQTEKGIDPLKYEDIKDFIFKDRKMNIGLRDLKVFDLFFNH